MLTYSHVLFEKVLPTAYYQMWMQWFHFIHLISTPVISESQINEAQGYLVSFSKQFTDLFGEEAWTPNHHFAFHLAADIKNFGPLTAFQLFACERNLNIFLVFYFFE